MKSDPALLKYRDVGINAIFYHRSNAVVGTTEIFEIVVPTFLDNLLKNAFGGPLCLINLKHTEILALRAYPTIRALPEVPDLAVIVTPASKVASITCECAERKPIVVIKAGRSETAAKAAASHTGALTGSDAVMDAAFRHCRVLRVDSIAEVLYIANMLSKQPSPRCPRLPMATNAVEPGVLATDALDFDVGSLAEFSVHRLDKLNSFLPPPWSHGNPINLSGDADADRFAHAVQIVARDANSDGMLVVISLSAMTALKRTAEKIASLARTIGKLILASRMCTGAVIEARRALAASGIPVYPYPDTAARMLKYMWQHSTNPLTHTRITVRRSDD